MQTVGSPDGATLAAGLLAGLLFAALQYYLHRRPLWVVAQVLVATERLLSSEDGASILSVYTVYALGLLLFPYAKASTAHVMAAGPLVHLVFAIARPYDTQETAASTVVLAVRLILHTVETLV